jgi:hypothetical protein
LTGSVQPGNLVRGTREFGTCIEAQLWNEGYVMEHPDEPWDPSTVAVYVEPISREELDRTLPRVNLGGLGPFHRIFYKERTWLVYGDDSLEAVKGE